MKSKKVLLVGASLTSGNRGVNALTRGAIYGLLDHENSPIIKILSYTTKSKQTHYIDYKGRKIEIEEVPVSTKFATLLTPISFIHKKVNLNKFINKFSVFEAINSIIDWADLILDISEGDSFSDIYGWKRFVMHSNIKLLAVNKGKNLVLLPQTMGPFKKEMFKRTTKYICNNSKMNYARDLISYNILKEDIGVNQDKIKYCADLAFYMKPLETKEAILIKEKVGNDLLVGINVSGLLYNGGYSQNNMFNFITDYKDLMNSITKMFLEKYDNVQVVFIPHVIVEDFPVEDDLQVCLNMYSNFNKDFPGRVHVLKQHLREDEIKGMLKQCNFFIGGRMHSCIGAISSGVPTVPIAYSRKFIGIWEQFGLESFVADPRKKKKEELLETIKNAFENREGSIEKITSTNTRFKNELASMFSSIEELGKDIV